MVIFNVRESSIGREGAEFCFGEATIGFDKCRPQTPTPKKVALDPKLPTFQATTPIIPYQHNYTNIKPRSKMKLILAGATGLLGTEIIKQSLQIREITQVVALAHQPVQLDKSIDSSKLKIIVLCDYGDYPEDVKAEFANADACIWYVSGSTFIA